MPNPPMCHHCQRSAFVLPVRLAHFHVAAEMPIFELGPRARCTTCRRRSPLSTVHVVQARQ